MNKLGINYQFRVLYFFGILFIVSGHMSGVGIELFTNLFPYYSFHTGLFVFCSGYFFNKDDCSNGLKFFCKKFRKMIVPLYTWNIIYGLFVQILKVKGFSIGGDFNFYNLFIAPINNGHQFIYNLGSWFVIPLFMIQIFNVLFYKITLKYKVNDWIIGLLYLILGMIGVKLSISGYNTDNWIVLTRFLFLLPFYGFGILYKNKLEVKDNLSNIKYFSIVIAIQIILYTIFKRPISYIPSWCTGFDNPFNPYLVGITGISFWLRISRVLTPLLKNNKLVLSISNNTYSIMIHHLTGFMIINTIFGIFSKFITDFSNFDWISYKSNIWYIYIPYDLTCWGLLYLIFGIAFSIFLKNICDKMIGFLKNRWKYYSSHF